MMRARIGRWLQSCLDAHQQAEFDRKLAGISIPDLTDQQISDLIHGRDIAPPADLTPEQVRMIRPGRPA